MENVIYYRQFSDNRTLLTSAHMHRIYRAAGATSMLDYLLTNFKLGLIME
jgi:hypothetical protein